MQITIKVRSLAVALVAPIAVAGCHTVESTDATAHIQLSGPDTRRAAFNIGAALEGSEAVMLLDEPSGILNIVVRRSNFRMLAAVARKEGLQARPSLMNAPDAFLAQVRCTTEAPCDLHARRACRITAETTSAQFAYFDKFARLVRLGGYASLGVFYRRSSAGSTVIEIPLYAQCDTGIHDIQKAWHLVGGGAEVSFRRTG